VACEVEGQEYLQEFLFSSLQDVSSKGRWWGQFSSMPKQCQDCVRIFSFSIGGPKLRLLKKLRCTLRYEKNAWASGAVLVAGVDEVGRGSFVWAGGGGGGDTRAGIPGSGAA